MAQPQGNLNRIHAQIVCSSPNMGFLNLQSDQLGAEGIRLAFENNATDLLPTMSGMVTSPRPYQECTLTLAVVKSTPVALNYQRQFNTDTLIGEITVIPDTATQSEVSSDLDPFLLHNMALENIREMSFAGTEATLMVTMRGYIRVNTLLLKFVMVAAVINRKLNIVLPPFEGKDGLLFIHSTPIGRQVFESCFRPMAKAMSSIVSDGMGSITGPSVAGLILQQEADALGDGDVIRDTLMPEIRRLTMVMQAGKNEGMMFSSALQRHMLDEDQASEVENVLVYFTLASWIRLPSGLARGVGLEGLQRLWRVQTTSLTPTEYMRSLQTATPEDSTGERPATTPPLSTAA